jgi:penicillin-binding protein 1A
MGQFTVGKVTTRRTSRSRRRIHRRAARRPRLILFVVITFLVAIGASFIALFLGLHVIAAGQADLPKLADQQSVTKAQTSQIFAADGTTLAYLFGEENRTIVSSQDLSSELRKAIVAIEDHRFYEHNGVDYEGLGRAIVMNLKSKSFAQGASTITQQLVAALFLDRRDISITRKIKEAALALQYEKKYTKDEILTQYLNTVYFGANAYGAEAGAKTYFGKEPTDLTLPEAAMLAGLPRAPSAYNPRWNPQMALQRRNDVLQAMWDEGYVTEERYDAAVATPIKLAAYSPYAEVREPYVVDFVKQQLISMFGKDMVFKAGLRVQTTIDPKFDHRRQYSRLRLIRVLPWPTRFPEAVALMAAPNPAGHLMAVATHSGKRLVPLSRA